MKVFLAGYNIDAEVINQLKVVYPNRQDITPETISAAYARISRDPRPVNELREEARKEVEKARKSNSTIIFGLGHSSVAEHAVFNFDVIDVSRLAMEELEKSRLCSFTEKSQRYITLQNDFLIPQELRGHQLEQEFLNMIRRQNDFYQKAYDVLKNQVYLDNPELAKDEKNKNLLEGWAKEDARYITSLSTFAQAGMTVNARNLEKMIRRFSAHPLKEIQNLALALHALVKDIAPSLVKYPESTDFEKNTYKDIKTVAQKFIGNKISGKNYCKLHTWTKDPDAHILAGLLFHSTGQPYAYCFHKAKRLSKSKKIELFKSAVKNMKFYDQVIREFELADLTYELTVSAACFGQLKRHRMATIITQDYLPELGLCIPPAIKKAGLDKAFREIAKESETLYHKIKAELPEVAPYILTNAHQRRVLLKLNLRELYHFSRLREDKHAQWDIRHKAMLLTKEAKKKMPVCTSLIGGKDRYEEIYNYCFPKSK